MAYKIIIAKGVKPLFNRKKNAKEYPFWDELITLLSEHEVEILQEYPIDELKMRLFNADIVICCDSFIQHFCWYIGKQAIVLWGKSDPLIFGHEENINLLKDRKYLRPDPYRHWEDVECDDNVWIKPQEILQEINKLI